MGKKGILIVNVTYTQRISFIERSANFITDVIQLASWC